MALEQDDLIRQTRLLIPDSEAIYGDAEDEYMFTDTEVADFLTLGMSSPKWAAGLAKVTIGSSEALILKIVKNYETSTNGAALMKEWVEAGKVLIAEGKAEAPGGEFSYFDIVSPFPDGVYPEGTNRPIGAPLHVSPPWGWR